MTEQTEIEHLPVSDTDAEEVVSIQTDGDTIKPFINALSHIVDEAKFEFDEAGIRVSAVDPANVIAIEIELHASAFDDYEVTREMVQGFNLSALKTAVRRARMAHDGTLVMSVSDRILSATVTRGYDDANVVSDDQIRTIDPDAIRQRPDVPLPEDIQADYDEFELSASAFADAFGHVATEMEHTEITGNDDSVLIAPNKAENYSASAEIDGVGLDSGITAIFSSDYIESTVSSVMAAKSDSVKVELGDESPMYTSFERTDSGDTVIEGMIMQAPRIRKE